MLIHLIYLLVGVAAGLAISELVHHREKREIRQATVLLRASTDRLAGAVSIAQEARRRMIRAAVRQPAPRPVPVRGDPPPPPASGRL